MSVIKNRREILFIYETKDCNPNGDPLDENRPRMDPDTEQALVTDVRIKRTIRDYLFHVKGKDILVRDTFDSKGFLNTAKGRAHSIEKEAGLLKEDTIPEARKKLENAIIDSFIDARLFGTTLPFTPPAAKGKEASVQITGPVQFSGFSRSFNRVNPQFIQGTAGFASKEMVIQKSFREDHILPYACIGAYGIINEISAKTTKLDENDIELLREALWKGTESLITRSKVGHRPLLFLELNYNKMKQIGDLPSLLKLVSQKDDFEIRSTDDYHLVSDKLVDAIIKEKENIEIVNIQYNSILRMTYKGKEESPINILGKHINVKEL